MENIKEAEVRRPKYKPRKDGNECGYKPMEFIWATAVNQSD
jgi:hypothetical protein